MKFGRLLPEKYDFQLAFLPPSLRYLPALRAASSRTSSSLPFLL